MSVNYVVSNTKITKCVEPDNVAWHATAGNPTTIGIEFDPRLSDEGYKRGGWLISELEKRYGKTLTLYPHSRWQSTACPGTISLDRLRQEANKFKQGVAMSAMSRDEVIWCYRLAFGADPSETEIKSYVGKDYETSQKEIQRYALNNGLSFWTYRKQAEARITDLQAKLAGQQQPNTGNPQDAEDARRYRVIKEALN